MNQPRSPWPLTPPPPDRAPSAARAAWVALAIGLLACSQSMSPGPVDPFDPNKPPSGGGGGCGSGSGSGSGSCGSGGSGGGGNPDMATPAPMCEEADRLCPYPFVLKAGNGFTLTGNEDAVYVQGGFKADGWTPANGVPAAYDAASKSWTATTPVPWQRASQYKFRIKYKDGTEKWITDPNNPKTADDGFGGRNSVVEGVTCASFTCGMPAPKCLGPTGGGYDWRDAVMYFAFVDRFLDGNPGNNNPSGDGRVGPPANWKGGDWAGVSRKIDDGYFTALGVNALWLTVPMDGTDNVGLGDDGRHYTGYHGYWPRDLSKPQARFGTEADLQALIGKAHAKGIKIILDYAMNHVHKDAPIYQQHQNDGWFNPLQVNGQSCVCGSGACPWDGPTAKVCWFTDYLPDFNFNNAAARQFSVQNAIEWVTKYNIDGLRLDAVKHIETSWLRDLRGRLISEVQAKRNNTQVYLVGETFSGDAMLLKQFIDPCTMLDGQFDFALRAAILEKVLMRRGSLRDLEGFYKNNDATFASALMSTFIGNHDIPRVIHFAEDQPLWGDPWAGGKERGWSNTPGQVGAQGAFERVGLGMTLLMTNTGVPLIYYGDEIGLAGAGDPDNRRMMPWSGYNSGQQWLLERMKKLGAVRGAHAALRKGTRTTLWVDDDTWAYRRESGADRVIVIINRADGNRSVANLPGGAWRDELSGAMISGTSVSVPARSAMILVQ